MVQSSTQFLARLTQSQNSWIQHRFFHIVRSGVPGPNGPETLLEAVKQKLHSDPDQARSREMLRAFDQFPEEALALAAHDIKLQDRSPQEKAQRDQKYRRQYFSKQPPTEAQIWKLRRSLHYAGPIESHQQASDLIDGLLNNRN
jgi:hypothetical protein